MRCAVLVPPHRQAAELACLGVVIDGTQNQRLSGPLDVLVHWGETEHAGIPGDVAFRLNRPEALQLAADPLVSRRLWRLSGLKVRWSLPRNGYYRVCIAHLEPVALFRLVRLRPNQRGRVRQRVSLRPVVAQGKVMQDLLLAAQRALHVLRLDFGIVDVALNSKREPQILRVVPAPPPGTRLGQVLAAALARQMPLLFDRDVRAVLGADPEFLMRDRRQGKLVPASRYLPRHGRLGLDNHQLRGRPGIRPIGEVRPEPHADPDFLVRRIRQLLMRLYRRVPYRHYSWIAGNGSAGLPIGGHIHFSRIKLTAGMMRALDVYLAIPFLLIENSVRARRRRRKYGGLGDFRRKRWGFEYRSISSWLVAPRFATAALTLAKLVVENWWLLPQDPFLEPDYQRAFYRCDKELFYPLFPSLWADLEKIPAYRQYAAQLEPLRDMVEQGVGWSEERDFRRQWGIPPKRRDRRRTGSRRHAGRTSSRAYS